MTFKDLENKIKEASQKYYTDGTSEYSDDEFDEMVDELTELNPNSEVLKVGFGYDIDKDTSGQKFKHKYGIAGSLSKCHNYDELPKPFKHTAMLYASLKLDGISVILYYTNGKLDRALTRGGGTEGIDITNKFRYIAPNLFDISSNKNFTGAIRGELVMSAYNFEKLKKINSNYKNARNSVAGLMAMNEPDPELHCLIDCIVYTVLADEDRDNIIMSQIVKNLKIMCPDNAIEYKEINEITSDNFESIMDSLRAEWYGVYPADGIVITTEANINNSHYITYESIAFKYPPTVKISRVVGIEWNLTKTRILFPRVKIDPVDFSGTTVTYVSGNNAKYILDNEICIGTEVKVSRRGEVIPHIESVISKSIYFNDMLPKNCPECGGLLSWNGVHLQCNNPDCSNANIQDVIEWIHYIAETDYLGNKLILKYLHSIFGEDITVEKLMNGEVLDYCKSLNSTGHDALFSEMVNKLYISRIPIQNALAALNVPRLGWITSGKLAKYPEVVFRIIDEASKRNPDPINLLDLNGYIGDANADSIRSNLTKFRRLNLIRDRIYYAEDSKMDKGTVVVTGKLSVKRSEFEKELNKHGYKLGNSVNKDTLCLITDDFNSNSSKNKSAIKYNILRTSESEFREKFLNI